MISPDFPLAIDNTVRAAIAAGSPVEYSCSGGKDSVSIAHATGQLLDALGHPRHRRFMIHADLGRIEWKSTPATVEAAAAAIGAPLTIVHRKAGDLISRWERRFELGCQRYEQLLTYHLTAPWSSATNRFCTAELKTQVILPELLRRHPGERTISVVGIRREESLRRRRTPISKVEAEGYTRANGANILTWHPGVDVTEAQVFAHIARHGLPLAEGYTLGSSRWGCAFCIFAVPKDWEVAARAPGNLGSYRHLVDIEAQSSFSFAPARWLGDVAPDLLPATLAADLVRGKCLAAERRRLEDSLPANLRYVKGWPQRIPTIDEASIIADVRAQILAVHRLANPYCSPELVRDRIAELFQIKREREAA